MTYLLLTTYYILFALLAWRRLHWAVLFIIATLPSYLIRFQVGPIPMTALEGMLIIVFIAAACHRLKKVRITPGPARTYKRLISQTFNYPLRRALMPPIGLFLLAATISLFVAPDLRGAAGIWKAYFLEPILFFLIILDLKLHHPTLLDNRKIIHALSLTALLLSLYAIYQRFTGFGIPPPWDKELRVTSIFPYPNALGLFLAPLVLLFVPLFVGNLITLFKKTIIRKLTAVSFLIMNRWNGISVFYFLLVSVLSMAAIVFAKSTGAIVGVAAGLFALAFLYLSSREASRASDVAISTTTKRLPRSLRSLAMTIVGGLTLIATLLSIPRVRNELLLNDWSGHVRKTQWSETWEMLKDTSTSLGAGRPILGAGLSGYQDALKPYHKTTYLEIFEYPHNIVLNFWSEMGLLGLLAFAWLVIVFFRLSISPLKVRGSKTGRASAVPGGGGSYEPIAIPAMASMVVVLVHGLVDVPYFKNDLAILFWIIYALGLTQAQQQPE